MNKIELLAPAGNLEKLKFAYLYGADACYIGGRDFSLRANNDLSTYSTKILYTSDLAVKDGSNIPNQEHSETVAGYRFRIVLRHLAHGILALLRGIYAWIPSPLGK